MNTNELRRENLIFEDVLGVCTVESIFNNKLEISVPNGKTDGTINKRWFIMDSYNFRPIPLTEDWLLKFEDIFWITKDINGFFYWFNGEKKYIKFVHSLQNIYFALTQKELTIN